MTLLYHWSNDKEITLNRYIREHYDSSTDLTQFYSSVDWNQLQHVLNFPHIDLIKLRADKALEDIILSTSISKTIAHWNERKPHKTSISEQLSKLPISSYQVEVAPPPPSKTQRRSSLGLPAMGEINFHNRKLSLSKPAEIATTNVNVITRAEVGYKPQVQKQAKEVPQIPNRRSLIVGEHLPLYIRKQLQEQAQSQLQDHQEEGQENQALESETPGSKDSKDTKGRESSKGRKDISTSSKTLKDINSHSKTPKDINSHAKPAKDTNSHSKTVKDTKSHSKTVKDIKSNPLKRSDSKDSNNSNSKGDQVVNLTRKGHSNKTEGKTSIALGARGEDGRSGNSTSSGQESSKRLPSRLENLLSNSQSLYPNMREDAEEDTEDAAALETDYMLPNLFTKYFQLEDTEANDDLWKELDSDESEFAEAEEDEGDEDDDYLFKM